MSETEMKSEEPLDPATAIAIILMDLGIEVEQIDWDSISEVRRYYHEPKESE